jgi:sugar lactone lactonase YvrE
MTALPEIGGHDVAYGRLRVRQSARRAIGLLVATLATVSVMAPSPAIAVRQFPEVIGLPNGWQPEGIAAGRGTIMYSGSRATGDVVAVDIRTGERTLVVDAPEGRTATGLELDRWGRLWVSGGATGQAYVYGPDGEPVETFQLAPEGQPAFINDVVITRDAAWFTDSRDDVLYRVPIARDGTIGEPEAVQLTGDFVLAPGFNLNGIDAALNGRWLIVVQSNTGNLYRVDPDTGHATLIDLGGASMTSGDGILVLGRTVYVVRNTLNTIAVVRMDPTFTSGEVVDEITSPDFDVPTTVAMFGNRLYLVNARFTTPPTPQTPYWITAVPR